MIDENIKREFRNQIRQTRRDLLYMLDWIESELDRVEETSEKVAVTPKKASERPALDEPLTDRHHWILDQLRDGVKLTRETVQEKFGIGDRQAKRILTTLTSQGLIDFERLPRPGHYVLRIKIARPDLSPVS